MIAQFPETKGLSLEGSAALFGAPDTSHLEPEKTQVELVENVASAAHVQGASMRSQ